MTIYFEDRLWRALNTHFPDGLYYCASRGFLGSAVLPEHWIQWLELDSAAKSPGAAAPDDAGKSLGGSEVIGVRMLSC